MSNYPMSRAERMAALNKQPEFPAENLDLAAQSGVAGASAPAPAGQDSHAVDSGFDFGTSPHGLSADLLLPVQETPEASSCDSPAKPVLTFSLTEDQCDALAFAALCQAEDLEEGYESDELEVREAISRLREAREVLNGRPL
jgi:hypothetical protein